MGSEQVAVHHPSLVTAQLCSGAGCGQLKQPRAWGPLGSCSALSRVAGVQKPCHGMGVREAWRKLLDVLYPCIFLGSPSGRRQPPGWHETTRTQGILGSTSSRAASPPACEVGEPRCEEGRKLCSYTHHKCTLCHHTWPGQGLQVLGAHQPKDLQGMWHGDVAGMSPSPKSGQKP